ncbi:MAG: hypothetical protein K0S65_2498 [Labilithrix sp.]|jgi:hypothetical protein|nr:hypothetical protein [Labilithrix sp.]
MFVRNFRADVVGAGGAAVEAVGAADFAADALAGAAFFGVAAGWIAAATPAVVRGAAVLALVGGVGAATGADATGSTDEAAGSGS